MRPLSDALRRLLQCEAGYTVRGRVRVQGPDSQWYNLSGFFGWDFLEDVTVEESIDNPVATSTVRVRRELFGPGDGLSLAPLVTSSRANLLTGGYAPLLDPGRIFRVEAGLAPLGQSPTAADWLPLFLGRIDDVDSGADAVTFKGRDYYGGALQDVYLEAEKVYGSDAGIALQLVLQEILADAKLGSFGLYWPALPEMVLGRFKQSVEPVGDALQKLALQRGWEVRQKFRPDTGDWGLWLSGPDRTGSTLAWSFGPGTYSELGELVTSLADVRTAVEIVYSDKADKDAAGVPKRKTLRREDPVALARYGVLTPDGQRVHRFARIAEAAASEIDTLAEATRFGDSFLADLSTADVGVAVELHLLHPALELGDVVGLPANRRNFNNPQQLAVRQVSHVLNSSGGRTRLALRGKPALSEKVWLSLEARPGIAPSAPFTGPTAPTALTVTNSITGAVLLFTAPVADGAPEAVEYELHLGNSAGFAIDTSALSTTLKGVYSTTRIDLTALAPGVPTWARLVSRDAKGNRGPASAAVALAPRYVSPSVMTPNVTYAALPLNSDFEAQTDAGAPPDVWTMPAGTWGTHALTSTTAATGSRAVEFPLLGTALEPVLASGFFAVREGDTWAVSAVARVEAISDDGGGVDNPGVVLLRWYSASFTPMAAPAAEAGFTLSEAQVWTPFYGFGTVPAGARFARVEVRPLNDSRGGALLVDSVQATQRSGLEPPLTPASFSSPWTSYTTGGRRGAAYYRDSVQRLHMAGCAAGGTVGTVAFTLPPGHRISATEDFTTASETGTARIRVASNGQVTVLSMSGTWVSFGGISFRVARF